MAQKKADIPYGRNWFEHPRARRRIYARTLDRKPRATFER